MKNATDDSAQEIVRQILNLAWDEWLWLQGFPCIRMRMLRELKRRIRILNRAESAHLILVIRFALATGCRMSEILHLVWRRVDYSRQVARLDPGTTKNGEGRGIPLNRYALLALRSVHGEHPRWCFTYQGKRMEAIGSTWKRALSRAAIHKFRFHDIRHTWAS